MYAKRHKYAFIPHFSHEFEKECHFKYSQQIGITLLLFLIIYFTSIM